MKITRNCIHIDRIRLYARHGVDPQEQSVGAYFYISIEAEADFSDALENDNLEGTVSYADIFNIIKEEMNITSKLLEHVAGRIIKRLFEKFDRIRKVYIKIEKENPPMGADCQGCGVSVTAERQ